VSDFGEVVVVLDVPARDLERLARVVADWKRRRAYASGPPNGVEVEIGRRVFDAGGNGIQLRCDFCRFEFEPDDGLWNEAVNGWVAGDDHARFGCPGCARRVRLVEWRGPFPWGFGVLSVRIWNRSAAPEEVSELAELVGRPVLVVHWRL
jgi:hypothetical protein